MERGLILLVISYIVSADPTSVPRIISPQGGYHYPVALVEIGETKLLIPANDNYIARRALLTGTYDTLERDYILSLLEPGQAVIEVGCNFGPYSISIARMLGPSGFLYCFEPFRLMYQVLSANVALNGLSNVKTFNLGISNIPSTLNNVQGPDLNYEDNYGAASLLDGSRKPWIFNRTVVENVTMTPLDSISLDHRISLLKVDVEGMEFEVLYGASELIRRDRPILYVENKSITHEALDSFEHVAMSLFGYACTRPHELRMHNIVICRFT